MESEGLSMESEGLTNTDVISSKSPATAKAIARSRRDSSK